jgi:hypothetical protein
VNGKWIASSSPSFIAWRSRPGASDASAIAAARPAAERVALYSVTAWVGRPPPASSAPAGREGPYSSPPTRASAFVSSRA